MNDRWLITSTFRGGRLEIPGRREPLGFGETMPWIGVIPFEIQAYVGSRRVRIVRSIETSLPKRAEPVQTSVSVPEVSEFPKPAKKFRPIQE